MKLANENDNSSSELFKNWIKENTILVDSNFIDDSGCNGSLYETSSKQQFFIPNSNIQKIIVESVEYAMAVDFGDDNITCSGVGGCCNIYTYGNGVTIRINPNCLHY
ncbi:MAG: hypothetical protein JXR68_02410 [Bacteroidales bacterium]|nr:hypothetical protein [Bacteroidales bacterium]